MRIRKSLSRRVFTVFLITFMVLLCVIMLYPFWNSIVLSLMNTVEAGAMKVKLFPHQPTLEAYRYVLKSPQLLLGYRNTILRTLIQMAVGVFLTFCGAYPLAKKTLPGRKIITLYLLVPMFFAGGMIPDYLLINSLGIFDSFWALVLPGLISIFNLLIARNFIMSIPDSMEESAMLDGASFLTILVRIIFPLSLPIIATIALWVSVATWNEWFQAMIYTRKANLEVLQTYLRAITIERANNLDDLMGDSAILSKSIESATIMLSIGPIVLIYPFFQKYFVKGVMVGSLKG